MLFLSKPLLSRIQTICVINTFLQLGSNVAEPWGEDIYKLYTETKN